MWLSKYDFWFFCYFYKVKNRIWKTIATLQINLYLLFNNVFKALVTSSLVYEGIGKEEES
jgi:hypothetical protein